MSGARWGAAAAAAGFALAASERAFATPAQGQQGAAPRGPALRASATRLHDMAAAQPAGSDARAAHMESLKSVAVGAALGTAACAATLSAAVRRKKQQRGGRVALGPYRAEATAKAEAAFKNRERFDLTGGLAQYETTDLEELFVDAAWLFHREETELIGNADYDRLKTELQNRKSAIVNLEKEEVAFIEASIAYYRGAPIMSDEEFNEVKQKVQKSGRRKDMTAFILNQRSTQYLKDDQMAKFEEAFKLASALDFTKLDTYALGELEEMYIDALWCYYREGRAILKDKEFDTLKQTLYKQGSRFPTLKRQEVAFVEATISWYRGSPLLSDAEYDELKKEVDKGEIRKDVTAFLLYERGEQFLDDETFKGMKEEMSKLGMAAVDLEECNVAQMEEMYVDALWAYYSDGVQLLSDEQYNKLKEELAWQGSGFPSLSQNQVKFVKASLAYYRGEPILTDEEWDEVKNKVLTSGARNDVTAFLLYTKGQETLDAETFDKMKDQMKLMGIEVKKAGSKALEQTLSITSDKLTNDIGEVVVMQLALGFVPFVLSIAVVWFLGLAYDVGFVPDPDWSALLSAEAIPLFSIGLVVGFAASQQLINFLDLQNPRILVGQCPSCESEIRQFSGGADPAAQVKYSCPECGCNMVLNTKQQRIESAGLGARISGDKEEDQTFDWNKAWNDVKSKAKQVAS